MIPVNLIVNLINLFFLVNLIPEQMTLTSWIFLANKTYAAYRLKSVYVLIH